MDCITFHISFQVQSVNTGGQAALHSHNLHQTQRRENLTTLLGQSGTHYNIETRQRQREKEEVKTNQFEL